MGVYRSNNQVVTYRILDATIGSDDIAADAIIGSKLPDDAVNYFHTATEVEIDHADSSPADLLAADSNNDRLIIIQAIASEDAAGGPDFDVGSETTDTNAAFDDIAAGAWVTDERWVSSCLLPAGEKLQCTIAAAGTAGAIKFRMVALTPQLHRTQLAEDALAVYGIPIHDIKAADGADLALSETAGDHFINFASNVWLLEGEAAQGAPEQEVSVSYFQFVLPPEYVAAGDVKLRIKAKVNGTGTLGTCTVDVEAYEQDGNGAVGSDICATAAAAITGTWSTNDFVITATNLIAGDIICFKITTDINETGGANAIAAQMDGIAVLLDVKG